MAYDPRATAFHASPQTSTERVIDAIYSAPPLHWVGDGFRVAGYFSAIPDAVRKLDPFLLLDYHPRHDYAPSARARGVGVHPHRGFETVTLAYQGSVAHHDSSGGGGVIRAGDVQWMTAASGILHKEYHEEEYSRRGGPFQMVQLWVNLPRENKLDPPGYQPLLASEMGMFTLPEGAGTVRVIAGEFDGVRGPARTFSPINLWDVTLTPGGQVEFSLPAEQTLALLIMEGEVTLSGARTAKKNDFVLFKNEGERVRIEAQADAQVLVLSGEPLREPVVQHGPFVMNTQQEILEAFQDFSSGKFGYLAD